jgi:glycerophosphoryl diester phosphodiesterase
VSCDNLARDTDAAKDSPFWWWVSKHNVSRMHSQGVKVLPWTPNTPSAWKRVLERGADGVITDDPESLIAYLKARGLRP